MNIKALAIIGVLVVTGSVIAYNLAPSQSQPGEGAAMVAVNIPDLSELEKAGETLYNASCAACHDSGAAGAPVVGQKGDWSARIKAGEKTLYEHAIKGFNGMPPKGGNMSLGDDQVKVIVDYMVKASK